MLGRLPEEGGVLSDTLWELSSLEDPEVISQAYLRMPSFPMTVL